MGARARWETRKSAWHRCRQGLRVLVSASRPSREIERKLVSREGREGKGKSAKRHGEERPMKSRDMFALVIGVALGMAAPALAQERPAEVSVTIDTAHPGARIEPAIYGQFAEHLGRGVYE